MGGLNVLRFLEKKAKKMKWNMSVRTEYYAIFATFDRKSSAAMKKLGLSVWQTLSTTE